MTSKIVIAGLILAALAIAGLFLIAGIPVAHDQSPPETPIPSPGSAVQPAGPQGSRVVPDIEINTTLPGNPKTMMVYKVVYENITESDFKELAEKLGFSNAIKKGFNDYYTYGHGKGLNIDIPTGKIFYFTTEGSNHDPRYLPGNEEAVRVADAFLESHGIRPDGAVVSKFGYNGGSGTLPNGTVIPIDKTVIVGYRHVVNNYSMLDNRMTVEIGGNPDGSRDVIEIFLHWNTFEPYKEYPVISPQEAARLINTTPIMTGLDGNPVKATVNNITFGYVSDYDSAKPPLPYALPVYYMKGTVDSADDTKPFAQYIPAVPELKEYYPEFSEP